VKKEIRNILVTGAAGQIGSELTIALRERYGADRVVASDIRDDVPSDLRNDGPFEVVDVTDPTSLEAAASTHAIDTIFHMAAILSATGEKNPQVCWHVNMQGTWNVLELGRKLGMTRIVIPSSIAVWGPGVPADRTPQETVLKPVTMYGVTKVSGELLGDYYVRKYGLDVRGLRYPGIISHKTPPGGGTSDYAIAIYYEAVDKGRYTCFVREDTVMPMMYIPDAIRGTLQLAEAEFSKLHRHCDFNLASMSFSAGELAASIRRHLPDFEVAYEPDARQKTADSWPNSIDDSAAREEWGWAPQWDLEAMTRDMLAHLQARKEQGTLYP